MSWNFGNRNSAIGIIVVMNFTYFAVWLVTMFLSINHPAISEISSKMFGVFIGVENALMLILNSEAKSGNGQQPQNPTPPALNPPDIQPSTKK